MHKTKLLVISLLLMFGAVSQANAALIMFTDRAEFLAAVNSQMTLESFDLKSEFSDQILQKQGSNNYSSSSTLVSEGAKALAVKENNTLSFTFGHDVFAIGFDVNELNASNLSYSDSFGHLIEDLFVPQADPFASVFFGIISDQALSSFSLTSTGTSSSNAVYGFDALTFTADPSKVPAPATAFLMFSGVFLVLRARRKQA